MINHAVQFKRGTSFSFLLQIPDTVEDDFFEGWTLRSQARRNENNQPNGFIAEVSAEWIPDSLHKQIRIAFSDTSDWPIGMMDLDVLFSDTVTTDKIASKTIIFEIVPEVTQ